MYNMPMTQEHFEALYPATTREKEIADLLTFIKTGKSCQLVSVPGAGRSNVLGLLAFNRNVRIHHLGENQKWFHFVLCNFSELRNRPLKDVTKYIFLSLVESLEERGLHEEYKVVHTYFKESLELNDELVLFNGLKKTIDYLAIEKELTVVLLFDRFDDYAKDVTAEFFNNLRILRNRAKYRFSVVFSLNRPLEEVLDASIWSDFYEFLLGNIIYLSIKDTPGLRFRLDYLYKTSGKSLEKSMEEALISATHGHGKLTRLAAELLLTNDVLKETEEKALIDCLLPIRSVRGAMHEIWGALTPHEQKHLEDISKDPTHSDEDDVFMKKIGLIEDNKLSIPLFIPFVAQQVEKADREAHTLYFDSQTNDIKRGTYTLSDQFTASEFKLLKFLLQNQDRVCERDEIINAVWTDIKTQEGVSNEALDQIMFRLRRKIEEDPNKPKHIQTIKGRGFRFIG